MKKLMIAAFAIAFAAVSQAATVTWAQMGCGAYGDADNEFEGTMYLMAGGSDVAASFIATVIGAGDDYETAFNTAVSSAIASDINWGEGVDITSKMTLGTTADLFVVAIDVANKGIYVSDAYAETVAGVGDTDLNFYGDGSYDAPFAAGYSSYSGTGGWYTAESIPEPTSGLLMLLGMAGLALRRRRA